MNFPFSPLGPTVSIAVTTTSGSALLGVPDTKAGCSIRVASAAGGQIAFIRFGSGAPTAVATDMPILPGTVEIFTVGPAITHVAAITATATATLYFTPGQGE